MRCASLLCATNNSIAAAAATRARAVLPTPTLHHPSLPAMAQRFELCLTRIHAGAGWTLGTSSCTTQQLLMRPDQDASSSNIVSVPSLTSMLFGHLPSSLSPEVLSEPGLPLLQVLQRGRCCLPPCLPPSHPCAPIGRKCRPCDHQPQLCLCALRRAPPLPPSA